MAAGTPPPPALHGASVLHCTAAHATCCSMSRLAWTKHCFKMLQSLPSQLYKMQLSSQPLLGRQQREHPINRPVLSSPFDCLILLVNPDTDREDLTNARHNHVQANTACNNLHAAGVCCLLSALQCSAEC